MSKNDVAILGAGMHQWGKWGRNFAEYGVVAIKDAIKDAGVDWKDVDFLVGGDTMRNGYPGYVAGATFAKVRATRASAKAAPSSPLLTLRAVALAAGDRHGHRAPDGPGHQDQHGRPGEVLHELPPHPVRFL